MRLTGASFATASRLVDTLARIGLLAEATGRKRNREFMYAPYLAALSDDDPEPAVPTGGQA